MAEKPRPRPPAISLGVAVCAFLLLYIPLVYLVASSFLPGTAVTSLWGNGRGLGDWTLKWYGKALSNVAVLASLKVSLVVGLGCTLISTVLGTAAALALDRAKFAGKKTFDALILLPLVMPEIVLGLSLLIWFVVLRLTLGVFSITLAHVTFSLSYIVITVRARLHGFDRALEEAARDLGATPWHTFWRVTLPLIWPGILSGALMAFTLSFDDFLITFFTAGVGSDTLPLKIYAMIKFGVSPEISALSTLMLLATLALVLLFFRPKPSSN